MKLVVQVKLLPSPEQVAALEATLRLCNAVATSVSALAYKRNTFRAFALHKVAYQAAKAAGLSAQPAVRVIKKVADGYATLRANIRAGNLGREGCKRRVAVESKPIRFRWHAAQPFDDRCLSWQIREVGAGGTVSIWAVGGRLKGLAFVGAPGQVEILRRYRRGETDLVHRDGKWFLYATCEIPEAPVIEPVGWLGVDLGIVNIAYTSDGVRACGKGLRAVRHRNRALRQKLQAKRTKSARRLLKRRRRKEARFATDTNHVISKRIVAEAKRTGRGIALEDLSGIRARVRLRKPQRATHHSWAFGQLGKLMMYKARRAGVALVHVDPAYTSQTCNGCGHCEKNNRNGEIFACGSCGVAAHADLNAARNIRDLGVPCWAGVMQPDAA